MQKLEEYYCLHIAAFHFFDVRFRAVQLAAIPEKARQKTGEAPHHSRAGQRRFGFTKIHRSGGAGKTPLGARPRI